MTFLNRTLLALIVLHSASVLGAERILVFDAHIDVHADGSMDVTETITVQAEGRDIKRGIYRDLPTTYRGVLGRRVTVAYTDVGVLRNGRPEPHHQENISNGIRIYIGDKDRFIDKGVHTYTLSYRTNRQLGFFDDHDELYWNVTGNEWAFPIDAAGASVRLPTSVPGSEMDLEAYTGRVGAKGRDYEAYLDANSDAHFRTTRGLAGGEGLTIVVSWPKGHVLEPSARQRLEWFVEDNGGALAGAVGLLALLVYYAVCWSRVGRDPRPGIVIPRYTPPEGHSPSSMRYVMRMGYDNETFSAALVNLAVNGHVVIHDDDGGYTLERTHAADHPPAAGESALLRKLFSAGDRITLKQSNHKRIKSAIRAHNNSLEADYEKRYFKTNVAFTVFGVVISVVTLIAAVIVGPEFPEVAAAGFMVVWLSGWTFGVLALGRAVLLAWRTVDGIVDTARAGFLTLFALPFVGGEIVGIVFLAMSAGVALVVLLLVLIPINWLFYELMKAPTRLGRKLLDAVEGFREYLVVAEKEELEFRNPPERTPELFERYLPYAMALDAADVWGEKFAQVIADARHDGSYDQPAWYRGDRWSDHSPASFASSLDSSLVGTVASSSTAPGSSSGAGGGGSSGGGGGGGGGGGW